MNVEKLQGRVILTENIRDFASIDGIRAIDPFAGS